MIGIYNGQYEFITTESTENVTSFGLHLKNSIHHEKQKILQNLFVSLKIHLDIQLNNQKNEWKKFRVSLCQQMMDKIPTQLKLVIDRGGNQIREQ